MTQCITAIFEDGGFKPDAKLELAAGAKVQLIVTSCPDKNIAVNDEPDELDRLCEEDPIDSGGARLTRDQLHERLVAQWANSAERRKQAFAEFEQFRKEHPINSGGDRMTREQLYDRR